MQKPSANEVGGLAAMAAIGAIGLISAGEPFFEAIGMAVVGTIVLAIIAVIIIAINDKRSGRS